MKVDAERLVADAVREALGGIINTHRAKARHAKKSSVRVKIPISEIHERVKSRLDGLRGTASADDQTDPDDAVDGTAEAIDVEAPSCAELREKWLPALLTEGQDITLTDDALELDVAVPPPRKAHAR